MKKKYFNLALAFLCLFLGQVSYGMSTMEDDWVDDGSMGFSGGSSSTTYDNTNSGGSTGGNNLSGTFNDAYINQILSTIYGKDVISYNVNANGQITSINHIHSPSVGGLFTLEDGTTGIYKFHTLDIGGNTSSQPTNTIPSNNSPNTTPSNNSPNNNQPSDSDSGGGGGGGGGSVEPPPTKTWYVDKDLDNYSSVTIERAISATAVYPYKLTVFGPDCDDNNSNVNILNKCGKCEVEPAGGKCPCKTSAADLKAMFSNNINYKNLETLANMINKYASDLGIDSKIKLQHLLSQTGHETGGFNTLQVTENLDYHTASFIPKSYTKFTMNTTAEPNKLDARLYINNPEKLANAAMCCKNHNGSEASGDGWKYRGRGIMQLTWKSNYEEFQAWYNSKYNPDIDVVSNPNLISSDDNLAVLSGMWFFKKNVLDRIKDFDNKANVVNVTIKINPGKKGINDRQTKFINAQKTINCN
ncbi:MAG: hypothetical protein KA313_10785 [Pseudarcicella sp.]|nr:hypothetical protein [Pseudarcicella sp.]